MTESQRCHFPIKKGFRDSSTPPQPKPYAVFLADTDIDLAEREHYRSVAPVDWMLIAGGFGERFADIFKEPGYRCERNEPHLLTQGQRTELNSFLTNVIRYL